MITIANIKFIDADGLAIMWEPGDEKLVQPVMENIGQVVKGLIFAIPKQNMELADNVLGETEPMALKDFMEKYQIQTTVKTLDTRGPEKTEKV